MLLLIKDINSEVKNGEGINFLTLRDDYQSVTGQDENYDTERKYRLKSGMTDQNREDLLKIIDDFSDLEKP